MHSLMAMLEEFKQEAAITQRVLDRVPDERLGWKPHERSMSLGQLALHIATVPAGIVRITAADSFDVSTNSFAVPVPQDMAEVKAAFERTVQTVEETLAGTSAERAEGEWRLMAGDHELACTPRIGVWRSLMLNHWYHHRGQMAVYLRLLDVPVPSIYGPSADERPFPA